jgi:hypothetical protein
MPIITFKGTVKGAAGDLMFMSISGPNHFSFNQGFSSSFTEPLNLIPGNTYNIAISAHTQGTFTFDAGGTFTSINPAVPDQFNGKTNESYALVV